MSLDAWRRYPRLWVPAAVFLLVNVAFLAGYRLVLADDAELGRGILERRESELARVRELREGLDRAWEETQSTQVDLDSFYTQRLATEEQMLTAVIANVKDLAARAGLVPAAIGYDKETIERQDLVQRNLDFRVEGSYDQLRQLINFLELSDSFLVLEEVRLGTAGDDSGRLGIDLRISALFADEAALSDEERDR